MTFMVAIGVTFILITVVGLVGNALVLLVIGMNKQLHDSTNILIANLALADLLFLMLCPPISAYVYMFGWQFSESLCYITVSLQYVTCYVSVWTLGLLAYDRFLSITNPTQPKSIRKGRAVVYACGALWVLPFLVNLPQMKDVGVLEFEYNGTLGMICVDSVAIATEESSVSGARVFYWGFNVLAYLLPLSLCSVFYFLLVRELWQQKLVQSKSSKRIKRHATKMVFAVILTFGICWFPQNFRFFVRGLNYPHMSFWERNTELLMVLQSLAQVLGYANSCINPILYGVHSERFRHGFHCILHRMVTRLLGERRRLYEEKSWIRAPDRRLSSLSITRALTPLDPRRSTLDRDTSECFGPDLLVSGASGSGPAHGTLESMDDVVLL